MPGDMTIDYGALTALERTVGFLIALAGAITATWVVEHRQRVVSPKEFKQARNIGIAGTAVFIALMFVFMAGSGRLMALGTAAGGAMVGCVVFFLWNVYAGLHPSGSTPGGVITYLGTFILYVLSGSVGLSAAGLLLYVVHNNPENQLDAEGSVVLRAYQVDVVLEGTRSVTEIGAAVPFRASSGQVNFGCEQRASARAVWQAPPGATVQGEIRAAWTNVANARSHNAVALLEDGRVIGTGTITGLELQRFPLGISNCPGGGHGEVIVSGTYFTRATSEERFREQLVGTASTAPDAARTVRLTLPTRDDVNLEDAVVTLKYEGRDIDSARITLRPDSIGHQQRSGESLFTVIVEDEAIAVTLGEPMP